MFSFVKLYFLNFYGYHFRTDFRFIVAKDFFRQPSQNDISNCGNALEKLNSLCYNYKYV